MRKPSPTDAEIGLALTHAGGSGRGAARILGCGRARIRQYIHEHMFEVPITDATPGAPVTAEERAAVEALQSYMADA